MHRDRLGLELTAASGEAARACDETLWEYVSFGREPGAKLKRALQADGAMPMALCLQGYFMHLMGVPALVPKARGAFDSVSKLETNPREKAHIAALGAWCDGELERACTLLEDIQRQWPRDILALKLANYLYFYLGDAANVRDTAARGVAAWDEKAPGYSHVLALHAFGLEESGDYAAAEKCGRRATELDPADPWAVHSVAHVMEMQGRAAEGAAWIEGLAAHWGGKNFFRFHLWWHLALMHWSAGRPEDALRLYDSRVWGDGSSENLSLCNDISLLARLELAGIDIGRRWEPLAEVVRSESGGSVLPFVDAHYALALGEISSAEKQGSAGRTHAAVGQALCEAMVAWRARDYRRVAERLAPVRGELWRVGGSHAQRDLFTLILLASALKTGDKSLARTLLAERARSRLNGALPARLTSVKE